MRSKNLGAISTADLQLEFIRNKLEQNDLK